MKEVTGLRSVEKKMYILGISCYYHDSSAALLKDGKIVAAAEEERFTRNKHDTSFPINAIKFCLEQQNITIKDISYIGFYEKPFLKFERVLSQHLQMFPHSLKTFLSSLPSWFNQKLRVTKTIKNKLKYSGPILYMHHHMAHAASAFLASPFKKAAILSIDGVGEWTTTAYGVGDDNNIHLQKQIMFPHSLGLLYSTMTAFLGMKVNNSEYKIMGLSPYGNMNKDTNPYYNKLKKVIDIKDDGSYKLNMDYFMFHYKDRMPSPKLCALLNEKIRTKGPLTQNHKDIAAALQLITEEVMQKILSHIQKETNQTNIVLAGGVALNSVSNGKLLRNTKFKKIWIQPNSSDGGTSIGACLYIYNTILGNKRKFVQKTSFLGPEFSTNTIKHFLEKNNISFKVFKDDAQLVSTTAKLLKTNNVIGWFQGKMEWGPRALGARSIISNATNPEMQDIMNLKVKHREKFRPFAPVVCEDDALTYFDCDKPVPKPTDFMLMVYPIKPEFHKKIPSVTHVDGSGRLQTIRENDNPLYYNVIKAFGKLSKIPILINTSFNIRGEPIVCTPFDAYKCMMGTGIDYLVINKFLIKRTDNVQHMWDSEKYAKD
jgi:carbamoyltransferase